MRAGTQGGLLRSRLPAVLYSEDVPSSSSPGVRYLVRQLADGTWDCTCPPYYYGHPPASGACKHITRVRCRRARDVGVTGGLL